MENKTREKECFRMLFVSGMLNTLANYGETEVITTEEGLKFLTDTIESFGMEYKVEPIEGAHKILMKDSMWGHWRSVPEPGQSDSENNTIEEMEG